MAEQFSLARYSCVRSVSKPYLFWLFGLSLERKADAPSYCKSRKWKEAVEGLELSRELEKQVASVLLRSHFTIETILCGPDAVECLAAKSECERVVSRDLSLSDFGALSVHSGLQMRASDANGSVVSRWIQTKRGEYEQGRMN
jgi:hypothetical protein